MLVKGSFYFLEPDGETKEFISKKLDLSINNSIMFVP